MKLDIRSFALACAIWWGLGLLVGTWWIILLDGAQDGTPALAAVYRGYTITPAGSLVGLFWAVIDGLVGGAIFAWLYNLLLVGRTEQPGA